MEGCVKGEECSSVFSFSGMFGEVDSTNMPVLLSSDYISFSLFLLLSGSKIHKVLSRWGPASDQFGFEN